MVSILEKNWRVAGTGCCFALFGLGGLVLSFILIPLITVFTPNHQRRSYRVQHLIQMSFLSFCKIMRFSRALDYRIIGAEKLKSDEQCLILANHPSLIDYVLIASQLKQCDCLVKSALWHNFFLKKIVQAAGYIPNRDPEFLISTCEEKFSQGNVLLIFPQCLP